MQLGICGGNDGYKIVSVAIVTRWPRSPLDSAEHELLGRYQIWYNFAKFYDTVSVVILINTRRTKSKIV